MKTLLARASVALALLAASAPVCTFALPHEDVARLDEALELYQQYSGKIVLRSPNLPALSEFAKPIPSSDTNGMRIVLEQELVKRGIEFVPLRELFVLAVESGWNNSAIASYISTIKPLPPQPISTSDATTGNQNSVGEPIPAGTFDFRGADLQQFLDFYSMLLNRTVLLSWQISSPVFKFRTQTQLTKADAIYMLQIALALNGIASVQDGSSFVQIAPIRQVAELKLRAPSRSKDEPLLDPKDAPDTRYSRHPVPGKGIEVSGRGTVDEFVAYYAKLKGLTPSPSGQHGGISVVFRAQTFLSKSEMLYAIETLLAFRGLAIVEGDNNTVRVERISIGNESYQKSK